MHACLLNAIFIVTAVKLEASKPCLTWSVQNNSITILFRTNIVSLPVLFYDPVGQEQAKCGSSNNSIACETSHQFGRIEYRRTAIILTIARITEHFKYGNWSCRYGQNTIYVLVSLLEGTVNETDLELTGSLTENDNIITLNCFTCWNVLTDSVEFLYNDKSVVNVRYIDGQCFYTNGECEPRHCACSRNNYEWKTKLQNYMKNIKISCKARFRDDFKKMEFFKYTTVVFNGTAFLADGTITEINNPFINDDKWKTKDNDTGVIDTVHDVKWYIIAPSVLVLVGLTILVIKICKRKEFSSKNKDKRKSAKEEQKPLLRPKRDVLILSDDLHHKDASTSSDDLLHQDWKDFSTSTEGIKGSHIEASNSIDDLHHQDWKDFSTSTEGIKGPQIDASTSSDDLLHQDWKDFSTSTEGIKGPQIDASTSSDDQLHQDWKDFSTSTEGIKESSTVFFATCHACKQHRTHAMCADCEQTLCKMCCSTHINYYKEHCVFQVKLLYMSSSKIQCKSCYKFEGTEVCSQCIQVYCDTCADKHCHPKINIAHINPESKQSYINIKSEHEDNYIKFKAKIIVHTGSGSVKPPTRVSGIAFLSDGIIVLIDNVNKKLQVFEEYKFSFEEDLVDKPRGLTSMTENKIAMTCRKKINIVKVEDKHLVKINTINMNEFGLETVKPFSISYDKDCFAVEVNQDKNGKIVILDERCVRHIISNKFHFAHFTGKTINLALDMENTRVFVSAMNRKIVSCVNFDGHVLWTYQLSSPRGVVLIPSLGKAKLLLTSRRDNTIYQLNADDGRDNVLMLKGKIKFPCCLAYHNSKRLLCIHVATENGEEDLLVYQCSHNATTSLYERTQVK